MKKVMLFAVSLFLCVGSVIAGEAKIQRKDCAMTLGKEFPGAKGSLKTDDDGNVTFDYDFTKGGRYVGVEIKLPAGVSKDFTVNFETKEKGTRASLIVIQKSGRIETKRKHYQTVDKIAVNEDTAFTKPGAELDGTAEKVLFRIESSANAPAKGTVTFKNITY